MTSVRTGRGRTGSRFALALLVVLAVLVGSPPSASAHASLVATDPADGAVLPEAPAVLRLTFDESVTLNQDAARLYDAAGRTVPAQARSVDRVVTVAPVADLTRGTYVLTYRVVSADSHPVAGSVTFSVGAPSPTVQAPSVEDLATPPSVRLAHGLLQGVAYAALFLAAGLVVFATVLLPVSPVLDRPRARLRRLARWAAVLTVLSFGLLVPVGVVYQRGLRLSDLVTGTAWTGWVSADGLVAVLVVLGLVTGVAFLGRVPGRRTTQVGAAGGAALALGAVALVGHTRSFGPPALVVASDLAHVLAAAVWFGGLVGLALTLPALAKREALAAAALARFSSVAGALLALVAAAGLLLGWRIVGSWTALVATGYGLVLLTKVALVGSVAAVAGWNRFRLLPAVLEADGFQGRTVAARRLRQAVRLEATGLVAVLLLTGFLVNAVPRPGMEPATTETATVTALSGDVRVVAHLEPGRIGKNTVIVQVQDLAGEPWEPLSAPTVTLRSEEEVIDGRSGRNVDSGTYAATLVIPRPGSWQVQVSVRVGTFTNPVLTLPVRVR